MVLWRTDLRASWRAQWISLAFHSLVMLALLLCPWPANMTLLWLTLLILIILSVVCSQRRIRGAEGELVLSEKGLIDWHGQRYLLARKPFMIQSGMLLVMMPVTGGAHRRLWVAADSMDNGQWRDLRRLILQAPVGPRRR